jgi:hypothetical protein
MDDLSAAKTQLDTANSAIKLFEPFLKRAETWRFGQRLVAGVALLTVAASLVFGFSDPRYTAAAVFVVMGVSFLTRERTWLTTRHIAIKDEEGRIRAMLTIAKGEPTLAFADGAGAVRFRCGVNDNGVPTLSLHDGTSASPRALLLADPATGPAFSLMDNKGQVRLQMSLSPADGHGMVGVISERGQMMLLASASSDRAFITGWNAAGQPVWIVPEGAT